MVEGHKISKRVEISKFLDIIKQYDETEIEASSHTFFRFSKEQRKIFKEDWIKDFIISEAPILVGIQNNGLYAVFYRYKRKILRIMLDIRTDRIIIVTFYFVSEEHIPRI